MWDDCPDISKIKSSYYIINLEVINMYELAKHKKSLESQKKIYKGLREILKTKPLNEVTVTDIKNQCHISRSTFYRNFNNVIDVLDVMLEFFYNRYLESRIGRENQLLYFFEYWQYHKDLINIISSQNQNLIKNCMKRHEKDIKENPYLFDVKYSILTSILCEWSNSKKGTPLELMKITHDFLNLKCIDLLIDL